MEEAVKVTDVMQSADGFSRWLGIQFDVIEPGRAVLRMVVRQEMLNGFGVCHGGVTFSLADSAMAFASNGGSDVHVAIESRIVFPHPVRAGDELIATARQLCAGGRIGHYEVEVRLTEGTLVAQFNGCVYRTKTTATHLISGGAR